MVYRMMLLTKMAKHRFIDQYGFPVDGAGKGNNAERKLHLGCGQIYLKGYTNIDYPPSNQSVQRVKADRYADIAELDYPKKSIDEIRLHHVFEHFDRPTALALLCRWREWLKPGGLLRLETPDTTASCKLMVSPRLSYPTKQQIMRHLYGSHEAKWAAHRDGWYKEKYLHVLKKLGYENIRFKYNRWGYLRNIEVRAYRSNENVSSRDYKNRSRKILISSTIRVNTIEKFVPGGTERTLLQYWLKVWQKKYEGE